MIARNASADLSGDYPNCSDTAAANAYPFGTYFDSIQATPNGSYDSTDTAGLAAWCAHTDNQGRQILKVVFNKYATLGGENWIHGSFRIEFNPIGTSTWTGSSDEQQALLPGNDLYYLTKLGRLELLGIPQIFYEPLYCNDDYDKIVPGLYHDSFYSSSDTDDRSRVEASSEVFTYSTSRYGTGRTLEKIYDKDFSGTDDTKTIGGSTDGYFMYSHTINHEAIFSAHDFTCCQGLGEKVTADGQCCSGFAVEEKQEG